MGDGWTAAELQSQLGLTTAGYVLGLLKRQWGKSGFFVVTGGSPATARPEAQWSIGPAAGVALGLCIGMETISASVVFGSGGELASCSHPEPLAGQLAHPERVAERITETVTALLELIDGRWRKLTGSEFYALPVVAVTVAVPFPVDQLQNPLELQHVDQWLTPDEERSRIPEVVAGALAPFFEASSLKRLEAMIVTTNMVNAEGLAVAYDRSPERLRDVKAKRELVESQGRWRGVLVVHAGCGVGAAYVVVAPEEGPGPSLSSRPPADKKSNVVTFSFLVSQLHTGPSGVGGAIGHLPAVLPDGYPINAAGLRPCSCGSHSSSARPHVEQLTSVYAINDHVTRLREPAAPLGKQADAIGSFETNRKRQRASLRNTARPTAARVLAEAIGPIVTMLNPTLVYLTGVISDTDFKSDVQGAVRETGPVPGGGPNFDYVLDEKATTLAARGAALGGIRQQLWRRVAGYHGARPAEPLAIDAQLKYVDQIAVRLKRPAADPAA